MINPLIRLHSMLYIAQITQSPIHLIDLDSKPKFTKRQEFGARQVKAKSEFDTR